MKGLQQPPPGGRAFLLRLLAAYAAVYVIWGSTYLAIRFAIETLPPLSMVGARFVVAGGVLYAVLRVRRVTAPSRREWSGSVLTGTLMLGAGVGGVAWAEQHIPSGVAALLAATVPLWMVLLEWARTRERPSGSAFTGLVLGFAGVALLVGPVQVGDAPAAALAGGVVLTGSLLWAFGSVYGSASLPRPANAFMASAAQMLAGGAVLLAAGYAKGERVDLAAVSAPSWLAWAYLVVFGSIVAFSAYTWLLRIGRPSRVGTYAYVNPVVAVLLGWALAGEPLSGRVVAAAAAVVGAVVLTSRARRPRAGRGTGRPLQPDPRPDRRPARARAGACPPDGPAPGAAATEDAPGTPPSRSPVSPPP